LGVSASAYYQRAKGERSARAVQDERLLERIERLHAANYHAYGYGAPWKALGLEGVRIGRDRVKRLMRSHGIQAPSAEASRGARPGRIPPPGAGPTWPISRVLLRGTSA
jgi:putative transposase